MLIKRDENRPLCKAILESRRKDNDSEVVSLLLRGLKKLNVNVKAVIEHGCGINAGPAAAFVKNNVSYHCIDMNPEMLYYFKRNLEECHKGIQDKVNVVEADVSKVKLKEVFEGVGRPLVVLFYNSFDYLLTYATSTHLAKKIAEIRLKGRAYSRITERLGSEASEMEKSREIILPVVVRKYYKFLKEGDVMVCISGTEPNLTYPYMAHTGAEIFYEIIRKLEWSTIILLTVSYELALKDAMAAYAESFKKASRGDDVLMQNRAARIREIKNRRGAILGVVCIK